MLISITSASGNIVEGTVTVTVQKTEVLNKTMDEVEMSPSWKGFLYQPKHKNIHTDGVKCYYDTTHTIDVVEVKDLEDAVLRFADANNGLIIKQCDIPTIAYECTIYDGYVE